MKEHHEQWRPIVRFPDYQVSDVGRIYSDKTGTFLQPSMNSTGNVKVNLMLEGVVFTKSVRTLVADAFLPDDGFFENPTPINLDGDHWNNHIDNLMWRPRWFAWKYSRQFNDPIPPEYKVPIVDIVQDVAWASTKYAGIALGLLWEYIYQSILTGRPVFPTGSVFILRPAGYVHGG